MTRSVVGHAERALGPADLQVRHLAHPWTMPWLRVTRTSQRARVPGGDEIEIEIETQDCKAVGIAEMVSQGYSNERRADFLIEGVFKRDDATVEKDFR